ncbi:Re/Si-specific NAD(P)(+) transhydrogenase subunit alpha [Rhodohalobacter sulfatireducens]|uniref:proton-translocating NAD(P)(+) transhydrogenase n=1 Tax=Rhodohalobacter sulfatireducens TaxID=2911366 RepID=A0ABS9KJ42_9BACT|nr:Re/Si-specific NAD(P)(+) transhydrogenase subunit alpha [Rhodohalobacter sulfatireducens]MCG2590874.1 Re/Si-specific NAD(P)(+) transhydrogenase subunit alpha [Rhodohalobacter sulfatireducens]
MIVGVCKETQENEKRVALTPEGAEKLISLGLEILIEKDAGVASSYTDEQYKEAGASIESDRSTILKKSELFLAVQAPDKETVKKLNEGTVLVSFIWPLQNAEYVELLKKQGLRAMAMDTIPRISRAQSMDALSSMSNIAGYKAALMGADHLDKYMPMMMTAAGTIRPAKVLVLGAGVAGLQAIATAKRLGAVVESFDIRPEVKEQVESLGATFVEVPLEEEETQSKGGYAKELSKSNQERQREVIHEHVKKSDIVITTALIPGKPAPLLVTRAMVEDMKPGSVVVDIAAEQGGNCEVTEPGETINHNGVLVAGPLNIPSSLAFHASKLYSKNLLSLLDLLIEEGKPNFNFEDEIILNATITNNGEIVSPFVKENR